MERRREVFIKVEDTDKISNVIQNLKKKRKLAKNLLKEYEILVIKENKMFDELGEKIEDLQNSINIINL
jgi:hypothetical protein